MALPLVRLEGTPYAQGYRHGAVLRERIVHNLAIYFERFAREVNLSRVEVLARAARYAEAIRQRNPDYYQAMEGVAAGAELPFAEIVALNVRYELFYDGYVEKPYADGCTAFAVMPDASSDGQLWIGENWDWIVGVQGVVLHTIEPDGLETLAFSEAGIVGGKIGMNSAGIGLLINGLTSAVDDWSRLHAPFHLRCYEILRSQKFDAAVRIITDEDRACSTNYLIAQAPNKVVNIEAAPGGVGVTHCRDGCIVHANHFVDPVAIGIVERNVETNPHSHWRQRRLGELVAQPPLSVDTMRGALRDHERHPYSVCFHIDPSEPPEEHYATLTSVIMNLHELRMEISDGPPCTEPYTTFRLRPESDPG
ncbi:MAG: peptidase C45 [Oscillochloris sp.]|nr:peptidase C45 [Oscillochloris sp.]